MKKYIISTGIVLAAVASVSALETQIREARPMMYAKGAGASSTMAQPARAAATVMAAQAIPVPTTGDEATDKAIKALHEEMEAKIKLIRDEYQTKIKAVIGDKKITNGRPPMASTTEKVMMMRQEMGEKREIRGSSTNANPSERRPMMGKAGGEVRGAEASADGEDEKAGIMGFFSRMFAR